jgi:hypothetical protein
MSSKKTSNASATASTVAPSTAPPVPVDDTMSKILFTTCKDNKYGEVTVTDHKSPGGTRLTLFFSSPMTAPTNEKVVVEAWGQFPEKVDDSSGTSSN